MRLGSESGFPFFKLTLYLVIAGFTTVSSLMYLQEMKNQCFGGEFMGEVFDHMLKR